MEDPKNYISEDELRSHNKKDDLWISIGGKIYDVSSWIDHHPGGDLPLLYFAGQDVTDVFLAYHPISSHSYINKYFTGYHIKDYKISKMSEDYRKMWSNFQEIGLFEKKGHGTMILLIIATIMFSVNVYGVLVSNNIYIHLICAGLMGSSWIQFGWVIHDSAHYQVMISPAWNKYAHFIIANCLMGITVSWWKKGHNAHHIATNSLEYDPTTQLIPFLAQTSKSFAGLTSYYSKKNINLDSDSLTRHLIGYQHFTFFVNVVLARVIQYAGSFNHTLFNKSRVVPNKGLNLIGLLVFWIWIFLLVSSLPNCFIMIVYVAITLIIVGIQSLQVIVNHICCDTYIGTPRSNDWVEKQTSGSLNIECSPWMDWFHGGLQFQIEHHLFPRMPRCQLREISPIVKELCKKHNLPYNCADSFWVATMMTLNAVREVAFEARNYTSPLSKHPSLVLSRAVSTM